jgi:predicted HTH transcriptional regulator
MNLGVETETLEFKKTTGELREGIVSLGSMLNKNGYGTLYFGVRDNGEVVGQQIGDRTLREISQAIANFLKPQVIPTITMELLDEKNVIKVEVEGTETPYASYGKYYMRSADEDRELSPEQLRVLMLKKEEIDSISRTESVKQNLTFAQLRTVFAARGLTVNDEHFEENTGLKLANGRYNYMANLLADENDVSIKVVTFAGKDKSEVLKRNEYGYKCLLLAMDQVLNYMESINETKVQIGTHQRQEEKLFNMLCFREAWINACLHTKWEKMNPPAVYIFSDRIEVISTGGLPGDLTKEEFYRGISRPVNIKLQKIFGQLGYVEQTGHGVPLIINHYGKQAFDVMDHYVNVIIPLNKKNYEENMPVIDRKLMLNPSQNRVYTIIKENPTYTIKTLVGETSFSDGYVRKILQYLKQNHYIERVGANKDGYWKVNE